MRLSWWQFSADGECLVIRRSQADSANELRAIPPGSLCEFGAGTDTLGVYDEPEGHAMPAEQARLCLKPSPPTFSSNYKIARLRAALPAPPPTVGGKQGIIGLMDVRAGPFRSSGLSGAVARRHLKNRSVRADSTIFALSRMRHPVNRAPYKILNDHWRAAPTTKRLICITQSALRVIAPALLVSSRTSAVTPIRQNLCRLDFAAA